MFKRISESKGGKIFHFALRQIGYDIPKTYVMHCSLGLGRQTRVLLGAAAAVVDAASTSQSNSSHTKRQGK